MQKWRKAWKYLFNRFIINLLIDNVHHSSKRCFLTCYLTVLQPTLDNYWGDSLTYPILICTLVKFWPEGHWKLHNESYKKLAKLYNPGKNIPPEVTILTNNLFCRIISVLPSIPKITAENKKALTYNWRENINV